MVGKNHALVGKNSPKIGQNSSSSILMNAHAIERDFGRENENAKTDRSSPRSSLVYCTFALMTILFRHKSRRPKTRRPRASWFIVASRTSRSRRARISVFQRCARTRRLSSPHVHRSSVERLARDLKHEKRPRLFVSCEGRVLRSVQDARSRSLVTTTDASSTTKLSQYARRRTAMSSLSGDGGGDQVAPASKPGIGRRRDGKAET